LLQVPAPGQSVFAVHATVGVLLHVPFLIGQSLLAEQIVPTSMLQ